MKCLKLNFYNKSTFFVNISGKSNNDKHPENIEIFILLAFHLDIFGKDINEEQSENIQLISITLLIFHLDILGNDDNNLQP